MRSADAPNERRRHQRLPRIEKLFLQTTATPAGHDSRRTVPGSTTDISLDGMQVCAADDLQTGCPVEIWIEAPGGWHGKLLMPGKVRWCSSIGDGAAHLIGVELEPLMSHDRTTWVELVQALTPSSTFDLEC